MKKPYFFMWQKQNFQKRRNKTNFFYAVFIFYFSDIFSYTVKCLFGCWTTNWCNSKKDSPTLMEFLENHNSSMHISYFTMNRKSTVLRWCTPFSKYLHWENIYIKPPSISHSLVGELQQVQEASFSNGQKDFVFISIFYAFWIIQDCKKYHSENLKKTCAILNHCLFS